jgi:hypothetical protein
VGPALPEPVVVQERLQPAALVAAEARRLVVLQGLLVEMEAARRPLHFH